MVHGNLVGEMAEVVTNRPKRPKYGGRQQGTPNRVTVDIRRAIRDLAEGYAPRVHEWLDRVAETDPGEATRLWLALLRFVTPTLAAAAIADVTPKSVHERAAMLSDDELMQIILAHKPAIARSGDPQLFLPGRGERHAATPPYVDNDE